MRTQLLYTALSVLAVAAYWAAAAAAASPPVVDDDSPPSKDDALLVRRLLRPVSELAAQANHLEALLADVLAAARGAGGARGKRQGAGWDMDYGWGGGRFGKRAEVKKRYDMYGMGGRFGRDVDHVDPEEGGH